MCVLIVDMHALDVQNALSSLSSSNFEGVVDNSLNAESFCW